MALFSVLMPRILNLEGGYVNDPLDSGGPTNRGVTLKVWQQFGFDKNADGRIDEKDVMLLTDADAAGIAKRQYWDYFLADQIKSQEIANLIVDWGWISGQPTAAMKVQSLLGLKADGLFGPATIATLNKQNPDKLFALLKQARLDHVEAIIKKTPSQIKWRNGWINRINSFTSPAMARGITIGKTLLGLSLGAALVWAGIKIH